MNYTNVHYGLMLAKPQLDILEKDNHGFHRMTAFNCLVSMTAIEPYTYTKGHYTVDLTEGQLAISKVELAHLWHCDADTALKVIRIFSAAGLISVVANNRTSIITMHCIAFWYVDGNNQPIKNRHYQRIPKIEEYKPAVRVKANKPNLNELPKVSGTTQSEVMPKVDTASETMTGDSGTTKHLTCDVTKELSVQTESHTQIMFPTAEEITFPSSPTTSVISGSNRQSQNCQSYLGNSDKHPQHTLADKKNGKGFGSKPKH